MYYTTYSSFADCMDPAYSGSLYMLFQSSLAIYSLLNIIKLAVASQNIFLGSPGVYTDLFRLVEVVHVS